jgi:hypothetical protein
MRGHVEFMLRAVGQRRHIITQLLRGTVRMTDRKGARPVPGPTIMMGVDGLLGSLKSGFFWMYTGTLSPTCAPPRILRARKDRSLRAAVSSWNAKGTLIDWQEK